MKLLEYEAKNLLRQSEMNIPAGSIVHPDNRSFRDISIAYPAVVKSQVPVGGRGKAGGVKLVRDQNELDDTIKNIAARKIKGFLPTALLVEEALDIAKEYYLSLTVNRTAATIDVVAHAEGGVEIESQEGFFTRTLDGKDFDRIGESLAELYSLEEKSFLLAEWLEKLYRCFIDNDATLIEINPLILTRKGNLVAGDCKMTLDDDAAFRHPEWQFEEIPDDANFVTLDQDGTIATIANGAGLAMATVDAVTAAGLTPANFLDIGGAATVDSIVKSFEKIMTFPHIDAIIINIFGGIVRCDDVARAIVEAQKEFPTLPRLAVRLSGTNSTEAAAILHQANLTLHPDLAACIAEVSRG